MLFVFSYINEERHNSKALNGVMYLTVANPGNLVTVSLMQTYTLSAVHSIHWRPNSVLSWKPLYA